MTRLSQVCENGDIQSPTARNHSNRYKSIYFGANGATSYTELTFNYALN